MGGFPYSPKKLQKYKSKSYRFSTLNEKLSFYYQSYGLKLITVLKTRQDEKDFNIEKSREVNIEKIYSGYKIKITLIDQFIRQLFKYIEN